MVEGWGKKKEKRGSKATTPFRNKTKPQLYLCFPLVWIHGGYYCSKCIFLLIRS